MDEGTGFRVGVQPASGERDSSPKAERGVVGQCLRAVWRSAARYRQEAMLYAVRGTAYGAGTAAAGLIIAWWTSRH